MCSNKFRSPVLLIEDDPLHADQIKKHFRDSIYDIVTFSDEFSENDYYDFESVNFENKIVIVDLNLQYFREEGETEGLQVILNYIWPTDRNIHFIVYSVKKIPGRMRNCKMLNPNWIYVKKDVDDEIISEKSLSELKYIVDKVNNICCPTLSTPNYNSHEFMATMLNFFQQRKEWIDQNDIIEGYSNKILYPSINMLNYLSQSTSKFQNTGKEAIDIAIGVFGSCGRLEMRNDSDIEFSVYCGKGTRVFNKAVNFWDRTRKFIIAKERICEGDRLVTDSASRLLSKTLAKDMSIRLENKYIPVFEVDQLLRRGIKKDANLSNRHLQILTETKPIFNPYFLYCLKKELIENNIKGPFGNIRNILSQEYFYMIINQFFSHTANSSKIVTYYDLKNLCFRTLNALALKIRLVAIFCSNFSEKAIDDKNLEIFFQILSEPGIHKVSATILDLQAIEYKNKNDKNIIKRLEDIFAEYLRLINLLSTIRTEDMGTEIPVMYRNNVYTLFEAYIDFCSFIKKSKHIHFREILNNANWILDTEAVKNLIRWINIT